MTGKAAKVAILYAAFGTLWILVSDRLVARFYNDPGAITHAQELKGVLYVLVTAILVFLLTYSALKRERAVERELAESRERYRTVARNFPNGAVLLFDRDLRFLVADGSELAAMGLSPEVMEGRTVRAVFPPDVCAVLEPPCRATFDGASALFEFTFMDRIFEARVLPVREDGDRIGAGLMMTQNVTERRRADEALRESQKMEAIGRLAGGVAHDFNNLLTGILGYAELLLMGMKPNDPRTAEIREIREASCRAADLTQRLLAFSRRQAARPRRVGLSAIVEASHKLLTRIIGEHVRLTFRPAPEPCVVFADPQQIDQVLVNLVTNARDAMPGGGEIVLSTAAVVLDAAFCREHAGAVPGAYARLTVRDTGVGMTPDVRSRIFEPYFTTKPVGKGTGLGLATVYGIVKQSGGAIAVDSVSGAGTRFDVYFPCAAESAAEAPVVGPPNAAWGSETILLAEDEDTVRGLAARILSEHGYRVLEARDGPAALALVAGHDGVIDLLLADVVMPGMSGRDLSERVRAVRSGIKVLFISGYSDDVIANHDLLRDDIPLLAKPFGIDALTRAVRAVLAGC
jgi:signal transduction histidine kinase/CheY-like chemotaxis protein